jgi:hypothetical protein
MAAFLASPAGEQVPAQVYSILAQSMALKNPAEALEWASRLPEDRGLQAGSDAFYVWRRSQPETAMRWLRELPSTDARRLPFFQSAIRSMANDPQAAEQLAAMTPTDRATARNVIETMSLPEDRRARLLEVIRQR